MKARQWNTRDELVGRKVVIYTQVDESEIAEVLGVADDGTIQVLTESGQVMNGNQWDDLD